MPQRAGKCTNFGLCTMADSREAITLPEGEDFSCPECGKMLAEVEGGAGAGGSGGGSNGSGKSKLALAGLAIALLAGGGYFLLVQPDPDAGKTTPTPSPSPSPTEVVQPTPFPSQIPTPPVQTPIPTQFPTPPVIVRPPTGPPDNSDKLQAEKQALRRKQEELDRREAELRMRERMTPTPTAPPPPPPPPPTPTPIPTVVAKVPDGPSSGTLIWEGTVHGTELVTIDKGVASRGTLISGKLPGKPVFIQQDNTKKVAIAAAPGQESNYQRLVLRVQGKGQIRVVLTWSLTP